jgi:hypothetical protein
MHLLLCASAECPVEELTIIRCNSYCSISSAVIANREVSLKTRNPKFYRVKLLTATDVKTVTGKKSQNVSNVYRLQPNPLQGLVDYDLVKWNSICRRWCRGTLPSKPFSMSIWSSRRGSAAKNSLTN